MCWARMSSGPSGTISASSRPARTPRSSAAHSTSSSRDVGYSRPAGVPVRVWLDRPTRCRNVAKLRGDPIWQTSSTGPMSMPSSRDAVATRARRSPARSRASTRCRRSLDRLPWCAATWSSPSRSPSWWATRSAIRRVFTNTSVVRCPATCPAIMSRTWPICSLDATAPSSSSGSSMARSRSRWCPESTIAQRGDPSGSDRSGPAPTSSRATVSIGRWVADRPIRCTAGSAR